VTGAYPEAHGLLGNEIYIPSVNAAAALDTGDRTNLEAVARAEGQLLTAPSLGEILQRAGRTLLGVSSGSTGSSWLLNHTVGNGAVIHSDYTLPADLGPRVLATLGPTPAHATPNDAQNQRAIDAYLKINSGNLGSNRRTNTAKYSPLQKKEAKLIAATKHIAQYMDRDTRPDFASTVMIPSLQSFISDQGSNIPKLVQSIEKQKKAIFGT